MANVELLKKKMNETGKSYDFFAKELNIDRSTLYRKLASSGDNFTITEANKLKNILGLSSNEATIIFFSR